MNVRDRIGAWAGLGVLAAASAGCGMPNSPVPTTPLGVQARAEMPKDAPEPAVVGEARVAQSGYVPDTKLEEAARTPLPEKPAAEEVVTPKGLKYQTYVVGTGEEAKPGMSVTVHYTGKFPTGVEFDSSRSKNRPVTFTLDESGGMIAGFNEGIAGMKVGERRVLTVPPELGYGKKGRPGIPPDATLIFDISLLGARSVGGAAPN